MPAFCFESEMSTPIPLTKIKVLPLAQRHSMARLEDILADPDGPPPSCAEPNMAMIRQCARDIALTQLRIGLKEPHHLVAHFLG